jgi:hypothetical protein
MTKNILKTALAIVSASSLLAGCDFEQPEAGCFVQDSDLWAVKYDAADAPVDQNGATCTTVIPSSELLGVFKFVNPDDANASPVLTMRPAGLADLGARDTTNPSTAQTASGQFAREPDANDFCGATNFSVATVDAAVVPEVPDNPATPANEAKPAVPATKVTYEFSDVRVYSAPSTPGTQLTGRVKYTKDGCSSTYVLRALWPATECDPAESDPALNCGEGSGLNPDFKAVCDGETGLCVPEGPIPAVKAE